MWVVNIITLPAAINGVMPIRQFSLSNTYRTEKLSKIIIATVGGQMEITLNSKDADFILRFLRTDLERLNASLNKLLESKDELQKTYNNSEIKDSRLANVMMDIAEKVTAETKEGMQEVKNDLLHCIELLTVGSEVSA